MQKIAIIIPCYNEEQRINIEHVKYLVENSLLDIYFANDGSTDNTERIINDLKKTYLNRCFVINYNVNQGKAHTVYKAVNQLMESKNYDYIGYFDADFSTPTSEIIRILNEIIANKFDFIFGSRVKLLNSKIDRKWYRHIIGRIIITLINFKLKLGIYDTQCGAKILKTSLAKVAFSKPFYTSWLFDVEVFIRLNNAKLLFNAKEFPLLEWKDIEGSKLGWRTFIKIIKELYLLNKKY
jgi:dolichyl-phosphate beta-glucosyltransferase